MTVDAHYRQRSEPKPDARVELAVPWQDTEKRDVPMRLLTTGFIGFGLCAALAFVHIAVGVVALALLAWWVMRQLADARGPGTVSLRVESGVLLIPASGARDVLRVPLEEVIDVDLGQKSINRVVLEQQVGAPMASTSVGPSVDVGRLVFVLDDEKSLERRVPFTESYASYSHCTEWLGKVRVFLRSHGWIPEDERAA